MAVDKKISQLTSLAQGDVDAALDVLPIVDTGADETKKITVTALVGAGASAGLSSVDINGGTIDGTTIGASSAAAGTFTTVGATTGNITTVNATTVDATNVEVTNVKAKDGTAAASIADSTGVVSITANPILSGGTANGVLYLNGSKVATSGSALTFDGTNLSVANTSGVTSNLTTNQAAGTIGSPLNLDLNFKGYINNTLARIRSWDESGSTGYGYLTFWTNDGSTLAERYRITQNGTAIWNVAGSEQMRLTSTGLGIGTASPGCSLHVEKASTDNIVAAIGQSGYEGVLYLSGAGSGKDTAIVYGNSRNLLFRSTATATPTSSGTTNMVLTSTGNLGIGTTSPGAKLELYTAGTVNLRLNGNLVGGNTVDFYNYVPAVSNDGFSIFIGGTNRLTMTNSGNLGLGVTPSAWSSAFRALQIGAGGGLFGLTGDQDNTGLLTNAVFDTTDGRWEYIGTGFSTLYQQDAGTHAWFTAPSGTAGNAITFTQAMTLDASGNLGVGATSPLARLDVLDAGRSRIRSSTGGEAFLLFQNTDTGTSNTDGLLCGIFSDEVGYFWNYENQPVVFGTNNAERARITSGGYFKASNAGTYLGSTGAYHELRTDGAAADWTARITNTTATAANNYGITIEYTGSAPNGTGNEFLVCSDSAALRAEIRSNGGLANYQSNNVDLSDARTKNSIAPAASMWDKVAALEIVTYKYNDQTHDDVNVGVIAQQVESVEPVWVDNDGWDKETPEGEEPLKTVYTKDITFAAIKALQEAMARIEQLEAKVAALEA